MNYYCDVCDKFIKVQSKKKHYDSNIHEQFDKCKHIDQLLKNPTLTALTK